MRCHDSRDQLVNRKLARKLLYDKLDLFLNGDTSKIAMRDARVARTKDRAQRRRDKKERECVEGEKLKNNDSDSDCSEYEEEDYSKYDDVKLDKIGKDIK